MNNLMNFLKASKANQSWHWTHFFLLIAAVLACNHLIFSCLLSQRGVVLADDFIGKMQVGSNKYQQADLAYIKNLTLLADLPNLGLTLLDEQNKNYYLLGYDIQAHKTMVTKFDLTSRQRVGDWFIPDFNFSNGALNPISGRLYLSGIKKIKDQDSNYLLTLDLKTLKVINEFGLTKDDGVDLKNLLLDQANNNLYLLHLNLAETSLTQFNLADDKITRNKTLKIVNLDLSDIKSYQLQSSANASFLYLANRNKIAKIDLQNMKYISSVPDNDSGVYQLLGIDQDLGYLYYSTKYNYKYAQIKRVKLASFSIDQSILNLGTTDDNLSMVIDNYNVIKHSAYLVMRQNILDVSKKAEEQSVFSSAATGATYYTIIKINLNSFVKDEQINLTLPKDTFMTAAADLTGGVLYLSSTAAPFMLYQADISYGSKFQELDKIVIPSGEKNFSAGVLDQGFGYFAVKGEINSPRKIIKVDLKNLTRISSLDLDANFNEVPFALLDSVNHLVYFVSDTGWVAKVDLVNWQLITTLSLGSNKISAAGLDLKKNLAYFVSDGPGAKVVKINIDPNNFSLLSSLTTSLNGCQAMALDTYNNFVYLADKDKIKGHVAKIDLSTFVVAETVETGLHREYKFGFIDNQKKYAYFVTQTSEIVRIKLSNFRYEDIISLPLAYSNPISLVVEPSSNYAFYLVNKPDYSQLVKLNLFNPKSPKVVAAVDLPYTTQTLKTLFIDDGQAKLYLGSANSSKLFEYSYSPLKGNIKAYKINVKKKGLNLNYFEFYSHKASGYLRLAIYDQKKNLLWQSRLVKNTANNNWLKVEISDKSKKYLLSLPVGTYYLAFQTDAVDNVASYIPGSADSGWELPYKFGLFPQNISNEKSTSETWGFYGTRK